MGSQYFRRTTALSLVLLAATLTVEQPLEAQSSTETYTYDALARLIKVTTTGGQNNGETQSLCYDAAGNRTEYKASTDGSVASCAGGSPPPPPPPPPPPAVSGSLAINDVSGYEADTLVFTVTLSPAQSVAVSVNYATATGTAGASDFTATSGTLTFTAGQTSRTISVFTNTDANIENTETFTLNLSSPTTGLTLSDGQGSALLFDDGYGGCPTCLVQPEEDPVS